MKYRVVYTKTVTDEYTVEAESFDEAQKTFDDAGIDAELFFIEDESGAQVIFN